MGKKTIEKKESKFLELYNSEATAKEIISTLKIGKQSFYILLKKHNLESPKERSIKRILKLNKSGKSLNAIAESEGCLVSTIQTILKKKGIYSKRSIRQIPITCTWNENGCLNTTSHRMSPKKGDLPYHQIKREGKAWLLHRWIFYINNGYCPELIMHTCDNPHCINPKHLKAGTPTENNKDRDEKGRTASGEDNGNSKLTNEQTFYILESKDSAKVLSKKFKISKSQVWRIKKKNKEMNTRYNYERCRT